jgi:histone-lysine N-methyltransferase ASH1L
MRENLQVRLGDAVYVLRDIEIQDEDDKGSEKKEKVKKKHNFKTIGTVNYSECDIFRVEQMWKDENGTRWVYGHHYLRPYETYHEPTRRFYSNELMRVPLYETINIDLIIDTCWVLDPNTYFKGRPMESVEKHVYVCEFKVDKPARSFSRMKPTQRPNVCTKNYAFYKFEERLKQPRNLLVSFLLFCANSLNLIFIHCLLFTATSRGNRQEIEVGKEEGRWWKAGCES